MISISWSFAIVEMKESLAGLERTLRVFNVATRSERRLAICDLVSLTWSGYVDLVTSLSLTLVGLSNFLIVFSHKVEDSCKVSPINCLDADKFSLS